jgi:hypothetical protein
MGRTIPHYFLLTVAQWMAFIRHFWSWYVSAGTHGDALNMMTFQKEKKNALSTRGLCHVGATATTTR